jgi:dGTPase
MKTSSQLAQEADQNLAPYAVKNSGDHARVYLEKEHPNKLPFQRDRDRVIHSKAFRRLKHKTQVIVSPKNDHMRDRLTHSIEGAQIARSLCRVLGLNEDLAEAAILAHDLGHPPFGHEGEYALDEILKPWGYEFDHNKHGFRIVTELEHSYPDFPGLNLTKETLAAIQKHNVPWEDDSATLPHHASLEGQIVNLADEISYYSHDIDDGLRAEILNIDDLQQLEIGQLASEVLRKRYPKLKKSHESYNAQFVRSVMHVLMKDIFEETEKRLAEFEIETIQDIYALAEPIAQYSSRIEKVTQELRSYLYENFYHSEIVLKHTMEGHELLKELFTRLFDEPKLLPKRQRDKINKETPKAIVIKDYVAGMTDNYARDMVMQLRKKLI